LFNFSIRNTMHRQLLGAFAAVMLLGLTGCSEMSMQDGNAVINAGDVTASVGGVVAGGVTGYEVRYFIAVVGMRG
jgi:hypothetical protein